MITSLPIAPRVCSCGFILTDSRTGGWLLAHPTNKGSVWDVPKGMAVPGESHLAAAIRELREETGIVLPESAIAQCIDAGQHPFSGEKDMHLYLATLLLDTSAMFCMSWVPSLSGPEIPEVDEYAVLAPRIALRYLSARKQQWILDWVRPHLPGGVAHDLVDSHLRT